MHTTKRELLAAMASLLALGPARAEQALPSPDLQQRMYASTLAIAKKKVAGGPDAPFFKKPYLDAAFNGNIFLWDTCFIAAYAKYHQDELPIVQALDNFYGLQESDGFICREYLPDGSPMWPKDHPVSINPPLFGFAELELFGRSGDLDRLKAVFPSLAAFFDFVVRKYRQDDHLFFGDAFGSGMDNIPRYPDGWTDDGQGIPLTNLHPEIFLYEGLSPKWNRQGRSVDLTAQMALFADNLATIGRLLGRNREALAYEAFHRETAAALNTLCWDEIDGFYYDLGYGQRIRRKHVGMFWVLLAGVVPPDRVPAVLAHLTDPRQFWRTIPVASFPADQPAFVPAGGYWLGSVWAPTNYMVIRGLMRVGRTDLADRLARRFYTCVADVFVKTNTFWENYAPDSVARGDISRPDFCGWTGLVPIAIYREFIA